MIKLKPKYAAILGLWYLALANIAHAGDVSFNYFDSAIVIISSWLGRIGPALIAIAVVIFIWGVVKYVGAGDDPEKKKSGRGLMVYGVIAIFVIVSVWGLVALVSEITGVNTGGTVNTIPTVDFVGGAGGG